MWLIMQACRRMCSGEGCLAMVVPEGPFDECDGVCVEADADDGWLEVDGVEGDSLCSGPLSPGEHVLRVWGCDGGCVSESESVEVKPFGYAFGLHKPLETDVVSPPVIGSVPDLPAFIPDRKGWDSVSVLAPSLVEFQGTDWLYYAGTGSTGQWADYALGVASWLDGGWVRAPGPILVASDAGGEPGDWDFYGQNTPEALVHNDQVMLFYNGRAAEDGALSIGVSTSDDGFTFARPDAPVLAGSGVPGAFDERTVAHPSVLVRDGVFEMWFTGGQNQIGYALSADGQTFERYCNNPVFAGNGEETWDLGRVKAPEVIRVGDGYAMTYSGCDKGCYQIGFASSADGLRWQSQADPLLGPTLGSWDSQAVQEGFLFADDIWYAGTDGDHQQIGVLSLSW